MEHAALHFQDGWRFRPTVTFNYGLAWSMDRNLNYDLAKPQRSRRAPRRRRPPANTKTMAQFFTRWRASRGA